VWVLQALLVVQVVLDLLGLLDSLAVKEIKATPELLGLPEELVLLALRERRDQVEMRVQPEQLDQLGPQDLLDILEV
jgi:hypothetical protein